MKGTKMMCASQASTAVCMSVDKRSVVRPSSYKALERTRLLDRRGSRVLEVHDKAHEHHFNRNGEHTRDGRHQRPRQHSSHKNSSTKDTFEAGKFEQELASVIPRSQSYVQTHQQWNATKSSASNEVVVMKVSLHCKGCVGKVSKHISKMEGVTSYTIELEKQKVTVVGKVSARGVLESISKVKNAEFWPTPNDL